MSQGIRLNPHQKDAVWRGMSSGNTLLAHAVGAGKTFTMAATGMKLKQAGLVKKPIYVVPNHMLEQFAREFMQLYPNARLLVATKEDLATDRRKLLTAKIAGGEWDGIIMTHSSFERIGMSKDYQERFLREQIANTTSCSAITPAPRTPRNIIKTIEKQKARREERLKDLLAEDKKDDGLVFDELGVDHVFIDEAHFFKNLETPTKMERVAGIQTGGSERAFDLYMKARYLGEQHPGHGVTFATGTPISNTMVEMYTMQRFLDPEGLEAAASSISTAGPPPSARWSTPWRSPPTARRSGPAAASPNSPTCPNCNRCSGPSPTCRRRRCSTCPGRSWKPASRSSWPARCRSEQAALQQELVARYERLRKEKVDPREDNALAITTDGRKLALDARLLSATRRRLPGVEDQRPGRQRRNGSGRTPPPTRGTQMIFCDMGVNPTPWGYCVYDEVIDKLVARGIPREQIAAVGDADSDAKKQSLFERVRSGSVRVLIGSTAEDGHRHQRPETAGGPASSRRARGNRPRSSSGKAGYSGRAMKMRKSRSIATSPKDRSTPICGKRWKPRPGLSAQVMTGDNAARRAEDIGGQELSYAEVKAIASGNPAVLTLAEADAELQRLSILKKNHADEQYLARRAYATCPRPSPG